MNKKYRDKDPFQNRIFTQHVRMGLDGKKHRRTLNSLVCGGSGAGKSRFYAKPNLLQASHVSYFVLDCKGELLRDCGGLLERMGYEIKVVDLLNMEKSHCYNPFAYLKNDNDVQKMVTNLFKSTTPKGSQSNDPFWDTAASMLLMALVFYLHYEAPEDEKNFAMIMEMLRAGEVREDDDSYQSPLDELFERLEMRSPDHIAVKYYKDYRSGSAKTLKSIQITLAARLEKFNLSSVAALTATDELDLASLGEKKVALFALIPDNDSSFNFLVSLLYASTFQELFYSADRVHGGSLPVPVHFLMDEFANVSLPDDFDKLLATMRSRNISVSIIIQNIAQLKALYEKQWESIMGNCDEFLYLGGNETSTHKLISENYLGKSTLWLDTYGKSTGHSGSYSTNNQITGRELLTPDEVRMLDNNLALLFIRGEPPLMDEKYDLLKHPNVKYTTDGARRPIPMAAPKTPWRTWPLAALPPATLPISRSRKPFVNFCPMRTWRKSFNSRRKSKMKLFNKKNKETRSLPMGRKSKSAFAVYTALVLMLCCCTTTAFAASDPLTVINNLSDFIFGLIRAIGMILLGFGVVQIGLSLKSHDPSQRANGFLTLAGGVVITFAKEILTLITG